MQTQYKNRVFCTESAYTAGRSFIIPTIVSCIIKKNVAFRQPPHIPLHLERLHVSWLVRSGQNGITNAFDRRKHEHCFNSLIVFKCKSNFQRPVFNLRDVEVNHVGERSIEVEAENGRLSAGSTEDLREEEADEQKCVEMGIDANGKPIKRHAPANNKKPGNNQKKGGNNNNNSHRNRTVGPPQQNRRTRCLQNNGNRNEASPSGYNGPSANNVGQSTMGANMNPSFGGPAPSAMEVPGKNSNHELFGKMIGRQMEQIQDAAVVDQLQNRMMNLMHDALAEQEATTRSNEKQQQQQGGFNQQQQQQRSAIAVKPTLMAPRVAQFRSFSQGSFVFEMFYFLN
ncbi:hypothetical protein B9Z55_019031 [Caenorhabditis nigoni]|uniref:Uncharacterized protein n=1 Tax=Caenorhabditis nigoni TaxID=1611254 RepID=A0A2G5THF6_9PELO|nr:hypothetical protein B9Z55_019031 [Caenorhabditis nigoni]